jgi:branched-chain amino acid transport system substrate-binding protein
MLSVRLAWGAFLCTPECPTSVGRELHGRIFTVPDLWDRIPGKNREFSMKFTLTGTGDLMKNEPSYGTPGGAGTSHRSTSPSSLQVSSHELSLPGTGEPANHAATISRRHFLAGSAAVLVLTALGSGRAVAGNASKLRVGFILPESGPLSAPAASLFSGFQLFLKELGADASEIEVLKKDSGPEDQKTLEALTELVVNREVHVLVAPPTIDGSEKAIHAVTGSNVVLLVTNPSVRLVGGEMCIPASFRVCANNYLAAQPLAAWALRNVGKKIFITGEDDEQGNEQGDYFAYGFEKAGGTFGDRLMLSGSSGKFQSVIEAIRKTEPNVVFAAFRGTAAAGFLKAMRGGSAPSGLPIIGPESLTQFPGTLSLAGDASKGVKTLTCLEDPVGFVEKVKKAVGGSVSSAARAAEGYDIGTIVRHLGQQVSLWNTDFPKVIASLQGLEFQGPRGKIAFDPNHEILVNMMVQQWTVKKNSASQEILAKLEASRTPDFGCGRIGFPKKQDVDRPEEEPTWEEKDE